MIAAIRITVATASAILIQLYGRSPAMLPVSVGDDLIGLAAVGVATSQAGTRMRLNTLSEGLGEPGTGPTTEAAPAADIAGIKPCREAVSAGMNC